MTPTPSSILDCLHRRGISVWSVAKRLRLHPGHLRRVLTGQREGSITLLKSVVEAIDALPGPPRRRQEDIHRLIDAATHAFFLKRGDFESAICTDAAREKLAAARRAKAAKREEG